MLKSLMTMLDYRYHHQSLVELLHVGNAEIDHLGSRICKFVPQVNKDLRHRQDKIYDGHHQQGLIQYNLGDGQKVILL